VKQALFGKEIIHLSDIDSTNNFAAKLLSQNLCQNGAVIMADVQTQGKGQRGNIWLSESGKNLLCSFVFKPDNLSVENQRALTWVTSLSLLQTLRKFNIEAQIKWPNDLLVGGKKIAGI
jgi:BirA family biotin operon repressor/biotin-[acetyl-CoA-carboxylase] ligase